LTKTGEKWEWIVGHTPPPLDPHSKVKHQLVRDYLYKYINVLMANVKMPRLRLTLVDGFAGGGLYSDGNGTAPGSPLIMLQTVREAEAFLNAGRTQTPREVDAQYHFVELSQRGFEHLKYTLNGEGYGVRIGKDIVLYNRAFESVCADIITAAAVRKAGQRAIFLLDQYSYDDIAMPTVRTIFENLQGAEVILTFNVDSLLTFITDSKQFHTITRRIGLEPYINWKDIARLKAGSQWRQIIQRQISHGIWKASGARFMTLFFVTPRGNRPWSYWLVHLSNAYRANDVMKTVHWDHGNSFGHSLEPGFFEIGYQANKDVEVTFQTEMDFSEAAAFDAVLRERSVDTLKDMLPRMIHQNPNGLAFNDLMCQIANQTNATEKIVKESLHEGVLTHDVQAVIEGGGVRTKGTSIRGTDILIPHRQRSIFLG
jgi:three-Cys-motif partner protein